MRATTIRPSGNPFQDMCTLVGLMTLTWAWIENLLAITIGVINENAGPLKGHSQPPLSLSKRIDCFKIALRDLGALKPVQQEGRALAMRLAQLGHRRHDFIHGAAWQFEEGRFEAVSIAVKSGNYTIENHRFGQNDALALCNKIADLQDDMTAFMLKVVAVFQK